MSEVFTSAKRSEVMSKIRGKGNKDTELRIACPSASVASLQPVLRHRVGISYEAEAEEMTSDMIVQKVLVGSRRFSALSSPALPPARYPASFSLEKRLQPALICHEN